MNKRDESQRKHLKNYTYGSSFQHQFTENRVQKKLLNATPGYNQQNPERGNLRTNNPVFRKINYKGGGKRDGGGPII